MKHFVFALALSVSVLVTVGCETTWEAHHVKVTTKTTTRKATENSEQSEPSNADGNGETTLTFDDIAAEK